jgi:anhydro-N-acetylmuramic acid kinase
LLDAHSASISDKLHTAGVFAAAQIAALTHAPEVLVTGGGALNTWFLEQLAKAAPHTNWQVPNKEMVMFKEAIAFAALGLQVLLEKPNTLPSATGASRALISGAVYNGCRI